MEDFLDSKYPEYFSNNKPTIISSTQTAVTEEFIHYSLIGYDKSLRSLEAYRSKYRSHVHGVLLRHFRYRNASIVESLL